MVYRNHILTNTKVVVSGSASSGYSVASSNFVLPLNAGEYLQLYWLSDDIQVNIITEAIILISGTTIPEISSVISTITQVSS